MEVFTESAHTDPIFNSTRYFLHGLDFNRTLTSEKYFTKSTREFLYLLDDIKSNPQSMARLYLKGFIKENQRLFWFLKITHLQNNLSLLKRVLPFSSIMPHAQSEFSPKNGLFSLIFYNDYYSNYSIELIYPSFMDFKFCSNLDILKSKMHAQYIENRFNTVLDAESSITTYIPSSIDFLMFQEVFNFSPYLIWQKLHMDN